MKAERVFHYFREISKIPRESYHEKEISDYLVEFGKKLGLESYQDENYNVILRRKAVPGFEDREGIVIQGHLDMVCEKTKESNHDFRKDGIELVQDGNIMRANGTTLGADNGIAIAMGMAILEDKNIGKGEIELLATTSEEVDLGGALALKGGLLNGKMLINIDSEDEGVLTVGSAGGLGVDITFNTVRTKVNSGKLFSINIENLKGGHSGVEINQKRGNANKIMAEILKRLSQESKIQLVEISGGTKDNAIPRNAKAVVVAQEDITDNFKCICSIIKEQYKGFEPDLMLEISEENLKNHTVISDKNFVDYLNMIEELPTGVNTWMKEYPEIVESSDNLAIVETKEDKILITISLRSSEPAILNDLKEKVVSIVKKNNGECDFSGGYPEWRFKSESKLRDKAVELYKKMYNKDMKVEVIHAGLECGAISQNYSHIDFISVGPNIREVHTPREYFEIDSVGRVYEYVVELINELQK